MMGHMGRYALYVWSAYGIVIGVLCLHGWQVSKKLKRMGKKHVAKAQAADLFSR